MALIDQMERQGNWMFRHRGTLPLVLLPVCLGLYLYTLLHPTRIVPGVLWYQAACFLVSLAGLVLRVYTVGYTPKETSGRNTAQGQIARRVNVTGIYSVVRHPLYLGNFLLWLGIALLTASPWFILFFCALFGLYYERIMVAEEQFLSRKFGDAYRQWADRTPAFIPALRRFVRPDLPFSWRKAARQEKNGLLALFTVFFLFDLAGTLVTGTRDCHWVWAAGFGVSLVAYLVLKYMKKRTRLLEEEGR